MTIADVISPLLDPLFPPRCLHCQRAGSVLCAACLESVERVEPPLCDRCGRALRPAEGTTLCAACAADPSAHELEMSRALAIHEGVIRDAILALKYERRRRVAEPLGDLVALWLLEQGWTVDAIIPVPLHVSRQRERGFNQAELIGRRCARRLGIPCYRDLLRTRETPPQVGLSAAERRSNVAGAFALDQRASHTTLAGKRLLLVDDVTTTGSTLRAAAHALRFARPQSIRAVCVSRPRFDDDDDMARRQPARVNRRPKAPA